MARQAGITKQTFSGYLNNGRLPSADILARWVEGLQLDANWLLTGHGVAPTHRPLSETGQQPGDTDSGAEAPADEGQKTEGGYPIGDQPEGLRRSGWMQTGALPLPLTGFAECGKNGWCRKAFKVAQISSPVVGKDWLAVLALGNSMIPQGIREGYVVFCDPFQPPATDEAVYVMRTDGSATLKVFAGQDADGWIILQGWLEPDEMGRQALFTDRIEPEKIRIMAPVLYVRRRL